MLRIVPVLPILCLLGADDAGADEAGQEARALALFDEAKSLAAAGEYSQACAKFEAADRLTGWLGVELNLADCYARVGRTASAWLLWRKAAAKAEALHDDRAAYARERAAALEPDLARLSITATESVEVRVDDVRLAAAELGVALPIDPGEHVVIANVGGRQMWSRRFTITAGATVELAVPPVVVSHGASREPGHTPRWLMWSLGSTGVALLGATAWLGISAKLRYDAAVAGHCDSQLQCDPDGIEGIFDARRRGHIATLVGAVGVVTAAAAVVLVVTRPDKRDPRRLAIIPALSRSSIGLLLEGHM